MYGKNVPACPVWVRSSFQFLKVSPYLVTYHWNGLVTTTLSKVVKVDQFGDLIYMINIEMDMKVGGRKHCWSMLFILCCEAKVVDDLSVNVCSEVVSSVT